MKLIECVPNFSEGRDRSVIDALAEAIKTVEGVQLLEVDSGADANRSVFTFVGPPEQVAEAAFRAIAVARERIDMRRHQGAHPRLGACDVCPLVPLRGVDMAECVKLARALGRRVAEELGIPVYLYAEAAGRPERRALDEVRRGEYESLPQRLSDPFWKPDFGRLAGCEKTGATIIGARNFLIAVNFNLNTESRSLAQDIALDIREAGRVLKDKKGNILRRRDGTPRKKPGRFRCVKAIGWTLAEKRLAQVSVNLTDFSVTPLAELFEEVCRQAEKRGARCTGTEIVGLVPLECLLEAGRYFARKSGRSPGLPEERLIEIASRSLGLSDLEPFDPRRRIIEYRLEQRRPLIEASLRGFVDELSSDSPAPGGGSAAAACGALAAALCAMVGNVTFGKKAYQKAWPQMVEVAVEAQETKEALLRAVDDDTRAFTGVMAAMKLKGQGPAVEEEKIRAIRGAVAVPREVLRQIERLLPLMKKALLEGNRQAVSDAAVATACARAAAWGAWYNVLTNLGQLAPERAAGQRREAEKLFHTIKRGLKELEELAEKILQRG
jgi:glutamate formiminotransferase/formiminotetrahydrofolate cyclodeaminase